MAVSSEGLGLIKEFEGLRLEAYKPTPDDVFTIGFGSTRIEGKPVKPGLKISEEEAEKLLREDVKTAEQAVSRLVKVDLDQNQEDALVSFVFNIGQGNFASSTLLKKLNAGDVEGAANEFQRWNKQGGKELAGLTRRRLAEADLFRAGDSLSEEEKLGRIVALEKKIGDEIRR